MEEKENTTHLFLTNIRHESVDLISLLDQPGKDTRCIFRLSISARWRSIRWLDLETHPSLLSRRAAHGQSFRAYLSGMWYREGYGSSQVRVISIFGGIGCRTPAFRPLFQISRCNLILALSPSRSIFGTRRRLFSFSALYPSSPMTLLSDPLATLPMPLLS